MREESLIQRVTSKLSEILDKIREASFSNPHLFMSEDGGNTDKLNIAVCLNPKASQNPLQTGRLAVALEQLLQSKGKLNLQAFSSTDDLNSSRLVKKTLSLDAPTLKKSEILDFYGVMYLQTKNNLFSPEGAKRKTLKEKDETASKKIKNFDEAPTQKLTWSSF